MAQYSGTSTMASITNSNRSVSPRLGTEVELCPEREPGVKTGDPTNFYTNDTVDGRNPALVDM